MSVIPRHDVHLPAVCQVCGHPEGVHYPGCRANATGAPACRVCGAREGDVHAGTCTSPFESYSAQPRQAPKTQGKEQRVR